MSADVSAKSIRAVLVAASALGLDAQALAEARGLSDAFRDVDARFPYAAQLGLWQDIVRRTGSESAGIEAATRLPWGHFEVVDYLFGTSENLGAAFARFVRYFALITTAVTQTLERDGERARLVRRYAPGCSTSLLAPAEFSFATTVLRVRSALGAPTWRPLSVQFAAAAPKDDRAQRKLFGCPVRFGAPLDVMTMEAATLDLPLKQPDAELHRLLSRHAEQLLSELDTASDLASRTRSAIVQQLRAEEVTLQRTARLLGMSARTLQRRLRESGASFAALVDDTRGGLARRYLADATLSIQETSHLLGFRDLRGFYRAFHRWEGCTPADFRRRTRAAEGGARRP